MKLFFRPFSLLVAAGLLLGLTACGPKKEDAPPAPKVSAADLPALGDAPKWQLKDLEGKLVSSEQLKGKVVVVDFWGTWCAPCRAEIPGYIAMQRKYGKDGLAIVGVTVNDPDPAAVKVFAAKNGMNYLIVTGDEDIQKAFGGLEAVPTTFLIDRTGKIRHRKIGVEEHKSYEQKVIAILGDNPASSSTAAKSE
jgi:thiol-disulfide isomerase/thioredoxin